MNGRPLTAMNIAAFPDNELPLAILAEILRARPTASRWPARSPSAATRSATPRSSSA